MAQVQPVSFDILNVNDIVVLKSDNDEKVVGYVVSKEENHTGRLVRVKIGFMKPQIIYIDDFLAEPDGSHAVYNFYTIEKVVSVVGLTF